MIANKELSVKIFKLLNDLNQDVKAVPFNKGYFFLKGDTFYSFGGEEQIDVTFGNVVNGKKDLDAFEFIVNNTIDKGIKINHNDFFQFQKEYKKNVDSIEISNGVLKIITDIPEVELISSIKGFEKELKENIKLIDNILSDLDEENVYSFNFSYENYEAIKSKEYPSTVYFNITDEENIISIDNPISDVYTLIKFHPKFFIKYLKTSVCTINIYPIDDDEFLTEIILDNKKYISRQFIRCLNI